MSWRTTSSELWNSLSSDLIGIQVEGKLAFINTAGAKLLGAADSEQLIGKPLLDFVHQDYRDIVTAQVIQTTEEGTDASPIEEKWVRLDGAVLDMAVVAAAVMYRGKRAVQFIARHINRRREAR